MHLRKLAVMLVITFIVVFLVLVLPPGIWFVAGKRLPILRGISFGLALSIALSIVPCLLLGIRFTVDSVIMTGLWTVVSCSMAVIAADYLSGYDDD